MLALVVFGLTALVLLKTDEFPDVQPPIVVVSVLYPGAAPETSSGGHRADRRRWSRASAACRRSKSSALDSFAVFIIQFAYREGPAGSHAADRDRGPMPSARPLPPRWKSRCSRGSTRRICRWSRSCWRRRHCPARAHAPCRPWHRPPASRAAGRGPGDRRRRRRTGADPSNSARRRCNRRGWACARSSVRCRRRTCRPGGPPLGSLDERTIRLRGRLATRRTFDGWWCRSRRAAWFASATWQSCRDGTRNRDRRDLQRRRKPSHRDREVEGLQHDAVAQGIRDEVARLQATLPPTRRPIVRDAGVRVAHSVGDVEYALVEGAALTVLVVSCS